MYIIIILVFNVDTAIFSLKKCKFSHIIRAETSLFHLKDWQNGVETVRFSKMDNITFLIVRLYIH